MSSFHQVLIGGYPSGGLMTDQKPLMLPDVAYSNIQNAYVWRMRTKKREGLATMGQLRRILTGQSLGNTDGNGKLTINIFTQLSLESTSSIQSGSITITVAGGQTFTETGSNGNLTNGGAGTGTINYATGALVIQTSPHLNNAAVTIAFNYYPGLPVMGELKQDISTIGIDNTIYFDTKYAYQFSAGQFQEFVPGTTWSGSNTNFFWAANYQGATPDQRFFFVTNNNIGSGPYDPIRYYSPISSTWTDLKPLTTATQTLWQGAILIPYYGRLVVLNTWEGATAGGFGSATNFFARARFSQIGDPTDQTNAWRQDIFGRGGFLDAPTNEAIVGAAFFRNTLIVFFEYSTWQLRYIGEYGLPFIFERISSDFGSSSQFSPIIFDQGVMAISDRGIIQAGASGVSRIDEQIPETAFSFEIQNKDPNFVHGIRDFEKEIVYWNYLDSSTAQSNQSFPNTVLLFNYKNNTYAQFRDTITCFGVSQFPNSITWDSQIVTWDSEVTWDNVDDQVYVEYIVAGNQQGYVFVYENPDVQAGISSPVMFGPTLTISAINTSVNPAQFTVANHNLAQGEIIYLSGAIWNSTDPGISNAIYNVSVIDANTISLGVWDGVNYAALNITTSSTYIGGGKIALLPKMNIVGKDFSPFQGSGEGFKLSYVDFQMDSNDFSPGIPAVTIQLFVNSYLGEQANLITGNQELINAQQQAYIITGATNANPCVVTSQNHSLATGTMVYITGVQGMVQLNASIYQITVVDANHFSLNGTDSTGFGIYTTGGLWNSIPTEGTRNFGAVYAWYRFYSTQYGNYLRIAITYDDALMNQLSTHQTPMELNAMNCWFKKGGRIVKG